MTTTLDPTSTAPSLPKGLSAKVMIDLYKEMVNIRKFELVVQDHYRNGKLPGFGHLYIGEEATAVGVCASQCDRLGHQHASWPRPCPGQGARSASCWRNWLAKPPDAAAGAEGVCTFTPPM